MKRRAFLGVAVRCGLASSLGLRAGQAQVRNRAKPARVGILACSGRGTSRGSLRDELRSLGYVDGQNIEYIEFVADEDPTRATELAAELARQDVDVVVAFATPAAHAVKRATQSIPIVMGNVADPIATGLVRSLSRPGGNITGVTFHGPEIAPKRLQLLKEILPDMRKAAFLGSTRDPNASNFARHIGEAAEKLGVSLQVEIVDGPEHFGPAFDRMSSERVDAVLVQPIFVTVHGATVADLARIRRLPSISDVANYARAGGLMSYGADWNALGRRAAHYVNRILNGANPGDLPVELPTVFELAINLQTANAIGVTIPPPLLALADEVIE